MPSKKDLKDLQSRALDLYDEDWEFREYLAGLGHEVVDAAVRELYIEALKSTDCMECMNCCMELTPQLDDEDVERLAKALDIPPKDLIKKYLIEDEDDPGFYLIKDVPCPFLTKNGCRYYDDRPKECRKFPNLEEKDFICRSMSTILDQQVCPMVFVVYQGMKKRLWKRNPRN